MVQLVDVRCACMPLPKLRQSMMDSSLPPRKRRRTQPKKKERASSSESTAQQRRLDVLGSSVEFIHAHAQKLSAEDGAACRFKFGSMAPAELAGTSNAMHESSGKWDRGIQFLYYAAMARALSSIKRTSARADTRTHISNDDSTPIALIIAGTGDLYNLCVHSCKAARVKAIIHAICLNKKAYEAVRVVADKIGTNIGRTMLYEMSASKLLNAASDNTCAKELLPEKLHVLHHQRCSLVVCDALGEFGGNLQMGELTNAAGRLFLSFKMKTRVIPRRKDRSEGTRHTNDSCGDSTSSPTSPSPSQSSSTTRANTLVPVSLLSTNFTAEIEEKTTKDFELLEPSKQKLESTRKEKTVLICDEHEMKPAYGSYLIPSSWRSIVAPATMPGAYAYLRLCEKSLKQPYALSLTASARCVADPIVVWSNNCEVSMDGKAGANMRFEVSRFASPSSNGLQTSPCRNVEEENDYLVESGTLSPAEVPEGGRLYVHGLAGTCQVKLWGGIEIWGGSLPDLYVAHGGQNQYNTRGINATDRKHFSSLGTVFFPFQEAIEMPLNTPTTLEVAMFRTAHRGNDNDNIQTSVTYNWNTDFEASAKGCSGFFL